MRDSPIHWGFYLSCDAFLEYIFIKFIIFLWHSTDYFFKGSCVKDQNCWSQDLVIIAMPPTNRGVVLLSRQCHISIVTSQLVFTVTLFRHWHMSWMGQSYEIYCLFRWCYYYQFAHSISDNNKIFNGKNIQQNIT